MPGSTVAVKVSLSMGDTRGNNVAHAIELAKRLGCAVSFDWNGLVTDFTVVPNDDPVVANQRLGYLIDIAQGRDPGPWSYNGR